MSFDLMFRKASDLYLSGAYTQAEEIYRQILAFAPENSDVLNMLGLIAAAKSEHANACSLFYQALKKSTNPLPLYFNLAVSLNASGKPKEALEAYQNALKLAPQTKEIYNNMGAIYEKLGNLSEAEKQYQKAVELEPNYVDALVNLAVLNKDINALSHLAETYPDAALPLYHLALFAFDKTDFKQALEYALKANSLQEAYDIKNLLAQIYLKLKDKESGEKYFHQALLIDPQSMDALINLGILEQNETYFKKALDLNPSNFEAHLSYGDFLYHENRKIEALEEYHKAVLLNADDPALSNNVALVLKDMQDYKGALDLLLNAFLKAPKNQDIALNISETLVLLFSQEPDEAHKIARLWQKNAPNNVFATHTLNAFENNPSSDGKSYAEVLFNLFAPLYDERLKQIEYNILNQIKELPFEIKGNVLDLGCGTGSAASELKKAGSTWTGVDISENMLSIARQKNMYNTLVKSDIVTFLKTNTAKYDCILCLDTLPYIKDIEAVIEGAFPNRLIFSIEKADENTKTFNLSPFGRYQHNKNYIQNILQKTGYKNTDITPLILRKENGKNVEGFLFVTIA